MYRDGILYNQNEYCLVLSINKLNSIENIHEKFEYKPIQK